MATKAKDKSSVVKRGTKRDTLTKESKKASKKTTSKVSSKSQELVVDSEDDDAAPEYRAVGKSVAQPVPVQSAATDAGKESEADEDESEDEDDDDDDSEEASQTSAPRPPTKVPANINGVKRSASEASGSEEGSDEESADGSLDEEPAKKRTKADAGAGPQGGHTVITKAKEKSYSSTTAPGSASGTVEQASDTAPIEPQPFEVPPGYVAVDSAAGGDPDITASSLAGKQIWHITAPSDLPLTSLHNIAQSALQDGKVLLNHKGVDYTIADDPTNNELSALLLSNGSTLEPVKQRATRNLRIQQRIDLPNLSRKQAKQMTGSAAAAEVARAPISTIRLQPKGLRMRFHPLGVKDSANVAWDDDEALADAAPAKGTSFQFPRALGANGVSESQNPTTTRVEAEGDSSIKKPKKKRKEKALANGTSSTNEAAEASHQDVAAATVAATPATKVVAPETDGDVQMTGVENTASKPSKEEKARRKGEKRLRKEAKLKDKTA
ncbi:hypothetical protein LTR78_008711 [Recurvomyces mirabilis]|uniref:Uncharacterized protein n=1 Tax=Recurvomyces mirabilis TaxID=574656 RepID=A0AAE0TSW3_9PEZI|nr:hypothetical protein LTR78_008711 [Recurvomyces mirabilis]KAK5159204.1 hypothetical protein LTS14_002346 [Recurvomyces mirabilis]